MKRVLILLAFLPMLLQAGVIMKRSGERLENVTIKSVTDSEIVYELNGVESTLPKSEVSAILYDNGQYVEIKAPEMEVNGEDIEPTIFQSVEDDAEEKRWAKEQRAREAEELRHRQAAEKAAAIENARLAKERTYQDGQIHRISSNSWYYINRYYSKNEINSIILSCPEAQAKYDDGHKWMISGWSSAGGSVALLIIGTSMMAADTQVWYENGQRYRYSGGVWATGLSFMLLGVCGIPTSVTIACIGHHRMNNAYKEFNNSCSTERETALSLNFGPTYDGIGLTLNF